MTEEHGKLFVISAPSGAGKTSLVRELVHDDADVTFSVSYTTRKQRSGEVNGQDYFFVTKAEFERMVEAGEFLEHARVFDNYYGTSRAQVEEKLSEGRHVILEIDWQGATQVRATWPDCESVFILPPSRPELERRLRGRGTDSADVIARRLRDAVEEMSHWDEFRYVVINDEFSAALGQLRHILRGRGEQSRADRTELRPLIRSLLAQGSTTG